MSNNPEVITGGAESTLEAQGAAAERSTELAKTLENHAEQSPDARAEATEKARFEANKEALMSKETSGSEKKSGGEPSSSVIHRVTKKQKNKEYQKTLSEIQSHMSSPARTFSKVLHNPAVEKTSEAIGSTIARPNAILAGSTAAFVVVALVYMTAKHYGYVLSGFESIGAFILGWMLGISIDYVRTLIRGGTNK